MYGRNGQGDSDGDERPDGWVKHRRKLVNLIESRHTDTVEQPMYNQGVLEDYEIYMK